MKLVKRIIEWFNDTRSKVCECEHFDAYHEGFMIGHYTACKVKRCQCQKFRSIGKFTFDDAPIKAQREISIC